MRSGGVVTAGDGLVLRLKRSCLPLGRPYTGR